MQRKKIAIYSSILSQDIDSNIEIIKKLILEKNNIDDFVIITKDLLGYRPNHYAVFYDFYLTFYDCDVVFLSSRDMVEKFNILKTKNIYLYETEPSDYDIPEHIKYTKLGTTI
jgi:hypothetical protein